MAETFSVSQYNNVLNSEYLLQVYQLWSQFLEHLCHENSQLSAFWMSYIHLAEDVLLGLIRSSREGNWLPHLYAVHHMIPSCFAYDKFNYARYLLVYYAQMANLPVEHPDVHRNFMEGHFFYAANRRESVWEVSRESDHGGNCQHRHKDDRDRDNIQLEDRRCK